jgi:glycosyltransferase involved in cell wall biosynthesis
MNSKLVSIIIPVYQAKDFLRKCVESCLKQKNLSEDEFEIILVDDGSTDGSASICDALQNEYGSEKIKVCHTENHGVSHARNTGVDQAQGRFVVFVDSDDMVMEGFLDNLTKRADENTDLVDETSSFSGTQKLNGYQYIENSILNVNTHVWGKLFSLKTIREGNIRFEDGLTIGEDLLFLIDFALCIDKKHSIRCMEDGDYVYTENEQSAMNRPFKESYLDQLTCWREAEERLLAVRENISPYAFVSLSVSQILTALLVLGKIATQDESKKNENLNKEAIERVKEQINHALKTRGAFAGLSLGHKLKVIIFRISPELYINLYARHKGVR